MLIVAMFCVTAALVLYSLAVWGHRLQKEIKFWHVIVFWLGLVLDINGTMAMGQLAGGFKLDLHGLSGAIGIILMSINVILATLTYQTKREDMATKLKHYSLWIWLMWLVAYVSGAALAMTH